MTEIKEKCLVCDNFKDFVSYDGVTTLCAQLVCYDEDISHYEKLLFFQRIPVLKKFSIIRFISKQAILRRLRLMVAIASPFAVLTTAFVVTIFISIVYNGQLPFCYYLVGAFSLMLLYTFLQLHILDLKTIRVFEVSFDNGTYQNLLNLGYANEHNRVREIHIHPTRYDSHWKLHIPIFSELLQIIVLAYRIVKRDSNIFRVLNNTSIVGETPSTRIGKEICAQLTNIKKEIEQTGLKIYSYSVREQLQDDKFKNIL